LQTRVALRTCEAKWDGPDQQVLSHGQLSEDPAPLLNEGQAGKDPLLDWLRGHVLAEEHDPTLASAQEAGQSEERAGLARSVAPEHGEQAARCYFETDFADSHEIPVASRE
jgi:hypothetical protein